MTTKIKKWPVAPIVAFIWIGFICSISFMEAWLKFLAPNVTLPIGLGIGKLVFGALNSCEWAFSFIILIYFAANKKNWSVFPLVFFAFSFFLLGIQTFFTLPALNDRIKSVLLNKELAPSLLHVYYLSMDVIKVLCLFAFGLFSFELQNANTQHFQKLTKT